MWKSIIGSVLDANGRIEKANLGMSVASTHTRIYASDRLVLDINTRPRWGGASMIYWSKQGSTWSNCIDFLGKEGKTTLLRLLKV